MKSALQLKKHSNKENFMKLENKIRQIFAKYEPEKVVQMIADGDAKSLEEHISKIDELKDLDIPEFIHWSVKPRAKPRGYKRLA